LTECLSLKLQSMTRIAFRLATVGVVDRDTRNHK
jgi:hypothetical protein